MITTIRWTVADLLDCSQSPIFPSGRRDRALTVIGGVHVGCKFPRGRLSVFVTVGEGCPPNKRPPPLKVVLYGTIPNNDF